MTDFISPVGRFVQGSVVLENKKDLKTGNNVIGEDGKPVMECFIALAIAKNDPGLQAFYQLYLDTARAEFPHLFDAQGNCLNNRFAWKIQDGDGFDSNGASVADKPGFAGHYIFKMATRYAPKCFHYGKYDLSQQIQNPSEVIKRGYYIRISGKITGNGVGPQERQAVPGLFVSPDMIELIAFGQEIQTGPDPNKVFGAAPINMAALPAGASMTPILPQGGAAPQGGPIGGLSSPPNPGAVGPAQIGLGAPNAAVAGGGIGGPLGQGAIASLPGASSASAGNTLAPLPGAGLGPAPQQNLGPQYTMNPSAGGVSFDDAIRQGWTPEALVQAGHATKNW